MKPVFILSALAIALASCGTLSKIPQSQLKDDNYLYRSPGERYSKVYVDVYEDTDSISVIPYQNKDGVLKSVNSSTEQFFLKRGIDFDLLVAPFKYRPSSFGFPRQLTNDFNGDFFIGYRFDRFRVHYSKTPAGLVKQIHHRAMTIGSFGGFGSSFISPWTTNYRTTDEYSALVLTRGVSLMFGVNKLTVGLGVGFDYLTDRDKNIWIYQNKTWYSTIVSINLN
jgi:hypothetical protein